MSKPQWWMKSQEMRNYYAQQWGVPTHGDAALFELLSLEMVQSGLNWALVWSKRAAFREDFMNFNAAAVAQMGGLDIAELLGDARIIRNRRKIEAIVNNAKAIEQLHAEGMTFDAYVWSFTDGKPLINQPNRPEDIPNQTFLSKQMARDMKRRGFQFVGPVIIYSFMQAAGLVDDHCSGWQTELAAFDAQHKLMSQS